MRAEFRPDRPSVAELAAGGIVVRRDDGRVLVIHEPSEDRWCLPKGHVEAGETLERTALREIVEETGLTDLIVGPQLAEVHYRFYQPDRERNVLKTVVYFRVDAGKGPLRLEEGFDEGRWVAAAEARRLVPYAADREAIDAFLASAPMPEGAGSRAPTGSKRRRTE